MGKKPLLAALIMSIMVFTISLNNAEALAPVGLNIGEWYEGQCFYSGNGNPLSNVTTAKGVVESIDGMKITFRETRRYLDMHEETGIVWVDVVTGQGNATGSVIASNLNAGDLIYTSPATSIFQGAQINRTLNREYMGAIVEVNELNVTIVAVHPGQGTITIAYCYYWNRATGLAMETDALQQFTPEIGETVWTRATVIVTAECKAFQVNVGGANYSIMVASNSTLSGFSFNPLPTGAHINFSITGTDGTEGYCNVTIPESLAWGNFEVYLDTQLLVENVDYFVTRDDVHDLHVLHIHYTHSTHAIGIYAPEVVPEFPSGLLLLVLTTVFSSLVATMRLMKKRTPVDAC